jgi:hypothetical protein
MPDNSSDSEKNFDISGQASTSNDATAIKANIPDFEDDFCDESEDEMHANKLSDRKNIDNDIWTKSGSFDVDRLHQLRELYQTHQKRTEEDDEQEYFDSLKERNTDELQSLRQVSIFYFNFEGFSIFRLMLYWKNSKIKHLQKSL